VREVSAHTGAGEQDVDRIVSIRLSRTAIRSSVVTIGPTKRRIRRLMLLHVAEAASSCFCISTLKKHDHDREH
jgi:hypothetical protein